MAVTIFGTDRNQRNRGANNLMQLGIKVCRSVVGNFQDELLCANLPKDNFSKLSS